MIRNLDEAEKMQMIKAKEDGKLRQEEYSKTLAQQVSNKNLQKKMDSVMTEHERRVNDADPNVAHQLNSQLYLSCVDGIDCDY